MLILYTYILSSSSIQLWAKECALPLMLYNTKTAEEIIGLAKPFDQLEFLLECYGVLHWLSYTKKQSFLHICWVRPIRANVYEWNHACTTCRYVFYTRMLVCICNCSVHASRAYNTIHKQDISHFAWAVFFHFDIVLLALLYW